MYEGLASGCPLKDLPSLRLMLSHVKEAGKSAPQTSSATGHRSISKWPVSAPLARGDTLHPSQPHLLPLDSVPHTLSQSHVQVTVWEMHTVGKGKTHPECWGPILREINSLSSRT